MRIYGLMIIRIRLVRLLSHSLVILYHNWYQMSNYFQRKWVTRKGIEPHPANGHQCYYASLDLSNDIETHGASTISTPCHAVKNKEVRKSFPHSLLILYHN